MERKSGETISEYEDCPFKINEVLILQLRKNSAEHPSAVWCWNFTQCPISFSGKEMRKES